MKVTPLRKSFLYFINKNEEEQGVCQFLNHVITCYSDLIIHNQPQLAAHELIKIVDIICSTYETEKYDDIIHEKSIDLYSVEKCNQLFNTIFEIYTEVVKGSRKQIITDNKFK